MKTENNKNASIPHPIPYQGSKRYLANQILQYFPADVKEFYEPFVGSAAITMATAYYNLAAKYHVSDLNSPLMNLWDEIINHPRRISNRYEALWISDWKKADEHYYEVRMEFNKSGRSDYLLYLLTRCVKSAVRYNTEGKFNQSPDKRRLGTNPLMMRRRIISASKLLKGKTNIYIKDYRLIAKRAKEKDLVYLDPPYQGVCMNSNSRYYQGVDFDELVYSLEELNKESVSFLVSYDGRTGDKKHGKPLPHRLGLKKVHLYAGRSSQATLLGLTSSIYESLYISPALRERIKR